MRPLTAGELAGLVNGRVVGDADTGLGPDVVIDSRLITPGALFVALVGEHDDGHEFVPAALAAGAAGCLVSRPPAGPGHSGALIVVDDPLTGLTRLGRETVAAARRRGRGDGPSFRVIGVTGSSGKTSAKDLLSQVLRRHGPTVAPVGSFNNEIGVPLTATGVDDTTRFLISEMGARGPGHIAYLCGITPPDVAVVLNVGHAHIGEFGSADVTARAKGELVAALGRGPDAESCAAVLNADDHRVAAMAERSDAPVTWFAMDHDPGGDRAVWATDTAPDDLGRFALTLHVRRDGSTERHRVQLIVTGRHQVPNALAATGAALDCGLTPAEVAAGLAEARPLSHWRMEVTERRDRTLVLNDAYNANPESMRAAVETVMLVAARRSVRRSATARVVLVLGDMLELGAETEADHVELGELVQRAGAGLLVAVGEYAGSIARGAIAAGLPPSRVRVVQDKTVAGEVVVAEVEAGDVVLIKASRGVGLEHVAQRLLADADGAADG